MLVNLNIPSVKPGCPRGVRVASQAVQTMDDRYVGQDGPYGSKQYWLQGSFKDPGAGADTDLRCLMDGYVVVTPLHFDLTDRRRLGELTGWDWPDVTAGR